MSDGSIRIVEMPDIGAFTDDSSVVGEHAGSGRFGASALVDYLGTNGRYVAPVTGSVARTTRSRLGEVISVKDFGAKGDGLTNDTAAIQAAVTNTGGNVFFPAGTYMLDSTILLPHTPGQSYRGAGIGRTIFRPCTTNSGLFGVELVPGPGAYLGLELRAEFSDFTIDAAAAGITGIYLKLCRSVQIEDVMFSGCAVNVDADQGSNLIIQDCTSVSNAIALSGKLILWSSDDTNFIFYPSVINYTVNCGLFEAGAALGSVDGAIFIRRAIQAFLFNCCALNLEDGPPADFIVLENNCQGCKILAGSSHGAKNGIYMRPGPGPQGFPSYTEIISHDVDYFSGTAIAIVGNLTNWPVSMLNSIVGGKLTAATADGLFYIYAQYQLQLSITGVQFQDYSGHSHGICFGLAACDAVMISNCAGQYGQYVLQFIDPPGGGVMFTNNCFSNYTTPIVGTITGWTSRIVGNYGVMATVTTPLVPASGVAVANNYGTDVMVHVVGGAAVTVWINGAAFANVDPGPGANFVVPANRSITLTYTTAPTWAWTSLS